MICTVLFFMGLAYFAWRNKRFKLMVFLLALALLSGVILFKAMKEMNQLADHPIGERRLNILQTAMILKNGQPEGQVFLDKVEELSKDDGVFSNSDYDQIKVYLPENVVKEFNAHYEGGDAEEAALNDITGAK